MLDNIILALEEKINVVKDMYLATQETLHRDALRIVLTNLINAKMWLKKLKYEDL